MKKTIIFLFCVFVQASIAYADTCKVINQFPLETYYLNTQPWFKNEKNLDQALLSHLEQNKRFEDFKNHFYSPWDADFVTSALFERSEGNGLYDIEDKLLQQFDNRNKLSDQISYGSHYGPYTSLSMLMMKLVSQAILMNGYTI